MPAERSAVVNGCSLMTRLTRPRAPALAALESTGDDDDGVQGMEISESSRSGVGAPIAGRSMASNPSDRSSNRALLTRPNNIIVH